MVKRQKYTPLSRTWQLTKQLNVCCIYQTTTQKQYPKRDRNDKKEKREMEEFFLDLFLI
jgi:hypothetical protein